MPKIKRPVPESDQSIMRPIAIALIQELLVDRMAMPSKLVVNYPGYTDAVAQPHGFISNKHEAERLPTTDKLFIDVTENYVEDWMPSIATKIPEQIPMWLNRELEVEMRPIYASVEMRITIRYRAKGKTDARRFYDYMMLNIPDRKDTNLHVLKYSYSMPAAFEYILKELHRLVENKHGYGEQWETFFARYVNPRFGFLTDQVGKNTMGVFSETQQRCIGYWDLGTTPDWGGKQNDTDIWEIEIPYVLRYEKPKDVYFSYPIVIHNQLISNKFRDDTGFVRLQDTQSQRNWSLKHLQSFESMNNFDPRDRDIWPGRYFPLFDEFMPRMVAPKTKRVFTCLVMLDEDPDSTDPLLLMNIKDLEADEYGMVFSPCMKEFIASERQWITKSGQSAVHLGLYTGHELMDPSFIEIDEDLNIRSTRPLNPRLYYHVRLGVVEDLLFPNQAAQDRLRAKPCAFEHIVDYILPIGKPRPKPDTSGGVITVPSYDDIGDTLLGRRIRKKMKTVQFTNLNAMYRMKK